MSKMTGAQIRETLGRISDKAVALWDITNKGTTQNNEKYWTYNVLVALAAERAENEVLKTDYQHSHAMRMAERKESAEIKVENRRLRDALGKIPKTNDPNKVIPAIGFYDCDSCQKKDEIAEQALHPQEEEPCEPI